MKSRLLAILCVLSLMGWSHAEEAASGKVAAITVDEAKTTHYTTRLAVQLPVAQIGEERYASLEAAIAAAQTGQTVELLKDVALTAKLTVDKGVTLNGAGKTVTATSLSPAFEVTTGESVHFENLTLTGAKRAIFLSHGSDQVTLVKCKLVVSECGIDMVGTQFSQVALTLSQTIINQEQVTEENKGTQVVYSTSSRGLSLWNMKNSVVTLEEGSEINGFSYAINVAGTQQAGNVTDTTGLTVKVIDSTIRSWAALNILGSGAHYEVTRSTLLGINTSSNSSNSFATIVFDHDGVLQATNNTLLLADSTVTNYQGGTCLEQLLRVDGAGHQVTFSGTVNLIDTTGKIEAALLLCYLSEESYKALKTSDVKFAEGATVTSKRVMNEVESELPLWPSINVKYYWANISGGYTVRLCDFFDAVRSERYSLCDGEFIDLIDNVPLTEDFTMSLDEGAGSFTLNLGDYAFKGGGHLLLPVGISAVTDTAASELFAAADPEHYQVVETPPLEEGGQYTYAASPKDPVAEVNGSTRYASLAEAIAAAKSGDKVTLLQDVTQEELEAVAAKALVTTGPKGELKDATVEVAEVLGGAFTVTKEANPEGQEPKVKLSYHYNFGVAGLEVSAKDANGAQVLSLSVVAKLTEGELPANRTLVGRTLQVVLKKGNGESATYSVANPVFNGHGECRVAVPWEAMTHGTNVIKVKVVK